MFNSFLNKLIPYRGTVYRKIGGKKAIDGLVNDFYIIMKTDPAAKECLDTHSKSDLLIAADKLKAFLTGWLGGPALYMEKYGHPRLRMRHFPFSIGEKESYQWLYCMRLALTKSGIKPADQVEMLKAFEGLTQLIKNRD